ncbi:MAG: hypothetical protein GXO02_03020 [Epsilonproteobacteria bacterium]|nr:hypothetical protein [Campylobacterota bacterium]
MERLLVMVHELWLEVLMASFMSKKSKMELNHFSDIIFRHFCWIENYLIEHKIEYDYNRDQIPIKVDRLRVILDDILRRSKEIDLFLLKLEDKELRDRISNDLKYITFAISRFEDEVVDAFNMKRELPNIHLSDEARDALTLFLFEESYKEYELILIYNYLKAHCKDYRLIRIFQILIDESFFHLKSFGELMAKMGILAVPRVVHSSLYKVEDIKEFLKSGIEEEIAAKEQCRELSNKVKESSKELSAFFDFIDNQENYHISLMKEALKYYEEKR